MRYKVPRYIDYQAKIMGPVTFKQFLFIFPGALMILFLYFLIENTGLFVGIAGIIAAISMAIAFGDIQGKPIYVMLIKFVTFSLGNKSYLWKKRNIPPKMIRPGKVKEEEREDDPLLPVKKRGSRLQETSQRIETS